MIELIKYKIEYFIFYLRLTLLPLKSMNNIRKERGKTQNIFLIETIINEKDTDKIREYVVMGSTGNVYHVKIKNVPECTCPDYKTRNIRCKHIYFVLIKVMNNVDNEKPSYSDEEIKNMFDTIPYITNNLIVDNKVNETYEQLKHNIKTIDCSEVSKKPHSDDLCPICLDDLDNGDELDFCKYSCGKQIHKVCYEMWCTKRKAECIFCKKGWTFSEKEEKYINLLWK